MQAAKVTSGIPDWVAALMGQRIGRAEVIAYAGKRVGGNPAIRLRCECGTEYTANAGPTVRRGTSACWGCSHGYAARTNRLCGQCFGLPHRRRKRGACSCGERYAPETPLSIADVMKRPRDDARRSWLYV